MFYTLIANHLCQFHWWGLITAWFIRLLSKQQLWLAFGMLTCGGLLDCLMWDSWWNLTPTHQEITKGVVLGVEIWLVAVRTPSMVEDLSMYFPFRVDILLVSAELRSSHVYAVILMAVLTYNAHNELYIPSLHSQVFVWAENKISTRVWFYLHTVEFLIIRTPY